MFDDDPLLDNSLWSAALRATGGSGYDHGAYDHFPGYNQVSSLGQEYLLTDDDELQVYGHAQGGALTSTTSSLTGQGSPNSTLVGSSSGLEINLIWDASVKSAANWSAIEAAVVAGAQVYTHAFANHVTLNIDVGLGEVGGTAMGWGALGESESAGYIVGYSTLTHALGAADSGLVTSGLMSAKAVTADSALSGSSFFLTSAEAKAVGLVGGQSTAADGYIGLTGNTSALYFPALGGAIKSTQYDAVGVAAHEISEVMGRIGLEGAALGSISHAYTALDLFRYSAPGVPDLTPTAGYFSTNLGVTNLATYNNPANGGDAADLATQSPTNAYNAFGTPGVIDQVTATDLLQVAALGYKVAAGTSLTTVTA